LSAATEPTGGDGGGGVMVVLVAMQWNFEEEFHEVAVHVVPSATLLYAMPVPVHVGSDEP
jgi:hypothetical protein